MYTDSNYRGRSWVFTEDARDLGQFGLNNQISSVRVYGGRWQICELMNFQNCRTVTGDIANLSDIGMNNRISSIREGGNWGSGGPGRSGGPPGGGSGVPVVLFSNRGFGGESLEVHGEIRNLQDVGFNDAASSIRVSRGRWQLCSDANFRGSCQIVTSSISRLSSSLERRVSSIRPY